MTVSDTYALTEDAVQFLTSLEDGLAGGMTNEEMKTAAKQYLGVDTDEEAMTMLAVLVAVGNGAKTEKEVAAFVNGAFSTHAAQAPPTSG